MDILLGWGLIKRSLFGWLKKYSLNNRVVSDILKTVKVATDWQIFFNLYLRLGSGEKNSGVKVRGVSDSRERVLKRPPRATTIAMVGPRVVKAFTLDTYFCLSLRAWYSSNRQVGCFLRILNCLQVHLKILFSMLERTSYIFLPLVDYI